MLDLKLVGQAIAPCIKPRARPAREFLPIMYDLPSGELYYDVRHPLWYTRPDWFAGVVNELRALLQRTAHGW